MMHIVIIIIGLATLGILVAVHELGHFLIAKACRIRVLSFSIGFGKPIVKKTMNETEYRIGSIPFGGYVAMAGEHPQDDSPPNPGDFTSKPVWQRALVASAGPAANFVFAMVCLWIMFIIGFDKPLYEDRPVIGAVGDTSAAKTAGLRSGDSIISINDSLISTWDDVQAELSSRSKSFHMVFIRDGRKDSVDFIMPKIQGRGIPRHPAAGLYASLPPIIGSTQDGSPAQKAGLKAHDEIVSINGDTIHSWYEHSQRTTGYKPLSGPMVYTIRRSDSLLSFPIVPELKKVKKDLSIYVIGTYIQEPPARKIRYSFFHAVPVAMKKSWDNTMMIFDVLEKLITRQVSLAQLAGPVGIVQMTGVVAMAGFSKIMDFMALIGINLAVLNLFPLVITDGGVLLFLLIEFVRRKPLAIKYQLIVNRIAIVFFISLFVYVTFNDIARIPELLRFVK